MLEIKELITKNKTVLQNKKNEYIVIHYTGNPNTSAENNAKYFYSTRDKVSAHYVIDSKDIYMCVEENYQAWHVGGRPENGAYYVPFYQKCRNDNSIGIELCCNGSLGDVITYTPETISKASELVSELMAKYHIPITKVITHNMVTGKDCPRNFNIDNFRKEVSKVLELKDEIEILKADISYLRKEIDSLKAQQKVYHYWSELDDETYIIMKKLYDKGVYKGSSPSNLNLTEALRRNIVINNRAGLYDKL